MHLRRAILLFAIVLGLTAVASSVAPPPREDTRDEPPPPATTPAPAPGGATPPPTLAFRFPATGGEPPRTPVAKGRHAVVRVRTEEPGETSIPNLGLSGYAVPGTPQSFDVLFAEAGSHDVLFRPVGGDASRIGTLVVRE